MSDPQETQVLIEAFVRHRQEAALTIAEVAEHMGINEAHVAELEQAGADPALSTLMSYARAVGLRLFLDVS